jgi:alpha-L-fucosidase 2
MSINKIVANLITFVLASSCCFSAAVSNNERLWYNYPATHWNSQALHIGNGYMGGSFYGGVTEERFDTTEKTMWTGGPGEDASYKLKVCSTF